MRKGTIFDLSPGEREAAMQKLGKVFGDDGAEIIRLVNSEKGMEHARRLFDPGKLNAVLREIRFDHRVNFVPKNQLIHGLFLPAEAKLELFKQLNRERGYGFTIADFRELGNPPVQPKERNVVVCLDIGFNTLAQTVQEAWRFTRSCQPADRKDSDLLFDRKHLSLLPGIGHKRGLCWRVIDFGANWDKQNGISPASARDPQTSPAAAILWEAGFSPLMVQAMDGSNFPHLWIPGLMCTVSGGPAWSSVPRLGWVRGNREVGLSAFHCEGRDRGWAVPAFQE